MNEELKQIATKARELGFKSRTVTTIHTEKYLLGGKNVMLNDMCFYLYLCDLQEWLRSKYGIEANANIDINNLYEASVLTDNTSEYFENEELDQGFNTYQEALQEGIKQSLKLIKV